MKKSCFIVFMIVLFGGLLFGQQRVATVTAVHDGDSYSCLYEDGTRQWIRLWGVDAPEVRSNWVKANQAYGPQAGEIVRNMIKGRQVVVDSVGTDIYGRLVAKVIIPVDTATGVQLAPLLIQAGCAWAIRFRGMSESDYRELKDMQFAARDAKVGLWGLPGRKILPSTFRNRNQWKG